MPKRIQIDIYVADTYYNSVVAEGEHPKKEEMLQKLQALKVGDPDQFYKELDQILAEYEYWRINVTDYCDLELERQA